MAQDIVFEALVAEETHAIDLARITIAGILRRIENEEPSGPTRREKIDGGWRFTVPMKVKG